MMATKREQLISMILNADDSVIEALFTIMMPDNRTAKVSAPGEPVTGLPVPSGMPDAHRQLNYSEETEDLNNEIKDIFGF